METPENNSQNEQSEMTTSDSLNQQQSVEQDQQVPEPPAEAPMNELEMLKTRAKLLGVQHSGNIGADTLRQKIKEHLEGLENQNNNEVIAQANALDTEEPKKKKQTIRQKLIAENMKLIRVRIQNLDPKKKDLPGEIFTVANEFIGTVRKFVPYGEVTDDGWHIPLFILKQLQRRKFLNIRTTKGKNGVPQVHENWAKEFAIEILEPLTKEELNRLAAAQIAAGSVNN